MTANYTVYNKKPSPCQKHYEELRKKEIRPDFISAMQLKYYKNKDGNCLNEMEWNAPLVIDEAYEEAKKINFEDITKKCADIKEKMSCDPMQQADDDNNNNTFQGFEAKKFKDQYVMNGSIVVKSRKAELVLASNGRFDPIATTVANITKRAIESSCENQNKTVACEHSEGSGGENMSIISKEDSNIEINEEIVHPSPKLIDKAVKTAVEHSSGQEMPSDFGTNQNNTATDESMKSREDNEMDGGAGDNSNGDDEDDSEDNSGDDGWDEENQGNVSREAPLIDVQNKMCACLNLTEKNYMEHFLHAHRCSKLEKDRPDDYDECDLPRCQNPDSMVQYCREILQMHPLKNDANYDMVSKILMHHSKFCPNPVYCNMLLCKFYSEISMDLKLDSLIPIIQARSMYEVVLSNSQSNQEMIEGVDFFIIYADLRGKGGFGEVYDGCFQKAGDNRPEHVAVKVCKITNQTNGPLLRSLACIRRLNYHPCLLLPDYVMKCSSSNHYLHIMECADTCLLSYLLSFHKHISTAEPYLKQISIISFFCFHFHQMAKAVQYIHGFGLVHGDIKPQNFVLTNNLQTVKLIDWDFLKEENFHQKSGTLGFAAPEVTRKGGTVGKKSDIYSLGRSIVPMVIGQQDVLGNDKCTREVLAQMLHDRGGIAELFFVATEDELNKRPSIDQVVQHFDTHQPFKEARMSYQVPEMKPPIKDLQNDKAICLQFVRNWTMRQLRKL